MAGKGKRKCSFCGRTDSEVSLLISGMDGFICNECAEQAVDIAKEFFRSTGEKKMADKKKNLPKMEKFPFTKSPKTIKKILSMIKKQRWKII